MGWLGAKTYATKLCLKLLLCGCFILSALVVPQNALAKHPLSNPRKLAIPVDGNDLVKAILKNDLEKIKSLVARGHEINQRSDEGWTPLMVAAATGRTEIIEYLIDQGSDVNLTAAGDWDAFAIATFRENAEVLPPLLQAKANPNHFVLVPFKFILEFLPNRSRSIMESLISEYEQNSGVRHKGTFELSPLMLAVLRRNTDIATLLMQSGAQPNLTNSFGISPLFGAVIGNDRQMARTLCDHGADINQKTQLGKTPLIFTAGFGFSALTQTLIEKGADIDAADSLGNTAVTYSVSLNRDTVLKILIDRGANLNSRDSRGGTPLLIAVERNLEDIVQILLRSGADPNLHAQDGWSPLHEAAAQDNIKVAQLLLQYDARINDRDGLLQMTPLMWASSKGSTKMVRLLLGSNADSSLTDRYGQTAELIARQKGHFDIERLLAQNGLSP
jgi:ankyrin repeat protein